MAKSLQQFIQDKGLKTPNIGVTLPTVSTKVTTPIATIDKVTPLDVIKEMPATAGKGLRWIGSQLMKPVSTVAVTTEQVGKAIGTGDVSQLGQIPSKIGNILTGKTTRSFSDIWRESLPNHPTAGTVIGTVIDIAADPLNFTGGALWKGTQLAGKGLTKIPGVQGAIDLTKPLFSTATKNKEFDLMIQHFRDLGDYRRADIIEQSKNVQKEVAKLKPLFVK